MKYCTLNNNYLDYLRNIESRIPYNDYGKNHYKPFFHSLFEIDDLAYVTQISSPKSRHRSMHNTIDFKKVFIETNHIKNGRRTKFFVGVVNLNYMFPVPKNLIGDLNFKEIDKVRTFKNDKEKSKYIYLLKQELKALNQLNLEKSAQKLYKIKYAHPEIGVSKRSLDFKELERNAHNYRMK